MWETVSELYPFDITSLQKRNIKVDVMGRFIKNSWLLAKITLCLMISARYSACLSSDMANQSSSPTIG